MNSASPVSRSPRALTLSLGLLLSTGFLALGASAPKAQETLSSNPTLITLSPEQAEILSHLSIVYRDDGQGGTKKTLRVSGIDVQLVNGLGATNGLPGNPESLDPLLTMTNGLGNLIVGYNEDNANAFFNRTGSHNLVLGSDNNYSSFGGLVSSFSNRISGPFASVSGGHANHASGLCSSISGGDYNRATGGYSSVTSGFNNLASGNRSSVSGGLNGWAYGQGSTVSGGFVNRADGYASVVSAGSANLATGVFSSVSGGGGNNATAIYSTVSGGRNRSALFAYSWVGGALIQYN